MFKKLVLIAILLLLALSSISCQTVAGVGKDIEWSAEKVSDAIGK